jgi:hypothetical protein
MIIVSFCGHFAGPGPYGTDKANVCRHERIHCVKNGVAMNPNANNAEDIMDACLENPHIFPEPKPSPSPSPSHSAAKAPSPVHS